LVAASLVLVGFHRSSNEGVPMHREDSSLAFDFVEDISQLDCADAVLGKFQTAVGRFGFSALALGELPAPHSNVLNPFFVSTWSPELAEAYVGEGHIREDPSIEVARRGGFPSMWSELEARWRAAGRSTRAFQLVASHGFREGFVIPVHGPGPYRGLVALLGEADALPLRDRAAIHLMALYLHERLRQMLAPEPMTALPEALPRLSPGEVECVKWLLAGKSDWEMGEILGISEATAHWRIERAKAKFGVKTRAQLAALAIQRGYVRA
jgi:LuxR family quorum sensing-dependent transcriptional regulator